MTDSQARAALEAWKEWRDVEFAKLDVTWEATTDKAALLVLAEQVGECAHAAGRASRDGEVEVLLERLAIWQQICPHPANRLYRVLRKELWSCGDCQLELETIGVG